MTPEPTRLPIKPERDYTPEQQIALKGLAQLLATAIKRKLDSERRSPDTASGT